MKRFTWLLISIFFVFSLPSLLLAEHWEKVVENGFDNPRNDYVWSMAPFKEKLYVGTLNLCGGTEIWRTDDSDNWGRVYKSYTRNYGIRCMYADGDKALYACASNMLGAQILKTEDGETWTTVARRGIGDWQNTTIRCMTKFKDYFYVGTGGDVAKLFRSKDGSEWQEVITNPGFDSTMVSGGYTGRLVPNNVMIGELAVFDGDDGEGKRLYAFTWTKDVDLRSASQIINRGLNSGNRLMQFRRNSKTYNYDDSQSSNISLLPSTVGAFEVWRSSDGENWEKVVGLDDKYGNGMGFINKGGDLDNDVITSTAIYNGQLYLGTEHDYAKTSIWRTSNGTEWEKIIDFCELGEKYNYYVWRMMPFNNNNKNKLYIGTWNMGASINPEVTGAQIWTIETNDKKDLITCVVKDGFDGETVTISSTLEIPKNYGIRAFAIFNNTLYAGTATQMAIPVQSTGREGTFIAGRDVGCEVWKMIQN